MKSDLHTQLQHVGKNYAVGKTYWICGQEVPMPVGVCDVWGMSRANGWDALAIEVKVSRPDFRSKSQKYKEATSFHLGNYQYILCQKNLIQPEEIHHEWGLLWYDIERQRVLNKKRAPRMQMTAQQKLDVLFYFLNNGYNPNRPLLEENQNLIPVNIPNGLFS